MLQIAVHRDNHATFRLMKSRRERRRLAEIAPQPDHLQPLVGLHQVREQLETAVRGRIVDEQNLIRLLNRFEDGGQPVIQGKKRRLFVMNRYHDGKHGNSKITMVLDACDKSG